MTQTGWTDIDVVSNGTGSPCRSGTFIAVAVGGGGTTTRDAGSGSGYVNYTEISLSRGVGQHLRAEVGGAQEATKLVDRSTSSTLTANPGGNGGDWTGADGYSGGGGDYGDSGTNGGNGGSGGSNGKASFGNHGYQGGSGSGFDISTIPLNNIVLR